MVMTSPGRTPRLREIQEDELSKEIFFHLERVLRRADFKFRAAKSARNQKGEAAFLIFVTTNSQFRASTVPLAIGKGGKSSKTRRQERELRRSCTG